MATTFSYITVKNGCNKHTTHVGGGDSLPAGLARFALVCLVFVTMFFLFGHLCCSTCPTWTSCSPFCGTLPCRICWTSWQSLPSWELRQTSSGNADSGADLPGNFPGNSGEEAAVSWVRDLWMYTPSQVRREWGPQPPWGGPCRPSDVLSAAAR